MQFPSRFLCAGPVFSTLEHFVPAPYFRKTFEVADPAAPCGILVTGLGFYRLWINGKEITKGILAPYISNPDHIVYFDSYELAPYLRQGENVLGFQLGNGMKNAPGGEIWDFQLAAFRGAPCFSFALETGGCRIEADESVKTAPSPLYFDDLRCGARYDARNEIPGWNLPGFDDAAWENAQFCEPPKGEFRICTAEPVRPTGRVLRPVSVKPAGVASYGAAGHMDKYTDPEEIPRAGLLFDFGENNAGYCRLKLSGRPGQRISMQFAEFETDGNIDYSNINFFPDGMSQRDIYICAGGEAMFEPPFTYHGFRYCLVSGLAEDQVKDDTLEFVVCTSDFPAAGSFACSDETANELYRMAERSDRANFYYFPTDCPQREKNGWTGDAALSAEHMLQTMHCENSLREWLRNVRAAQAEDGSLPGIVPTGGWGYGHGPSWDGVIAELPYRIWQYTGNKEVLEENADAVLRYLRYADGKRKENGLAEYGLGDWCPAGWHEKAPREYINSVAVVKYAANAKRIFELVGREADSAYAEKVRSEMVEAIRAKYVADGVACEGTLLSQSLGIYYGLFTKEEYTAAFCRLVEAAHENGDFIDVGILGARVLFRVLSDGGEAELAYKMITRPEYPSYGHMIEAGHTALAENFELRSDGEMGGSGCHHMFGDIKGWFIAAVAGLQWQAPVDGVFRLKVAPNFIEKLTFAKGIFDSPAGPVTVKWNRQADGSVLLQVSAPETVRLSSAADPRYETADPIPQSGPFTAVFRKK